MISYGLMVLGTLFIGVTDSYAAFIGSVFVISAGFLVTEATLSAVLIDEFPDKSTLHLNFSQTAFGIGALTGSFIAAALIDSGVFFQASVHWDFYRILNTGDCILFRTDAQ